MHQSPRESGFTLIELLVVIAIIGLLASIVLAAMNGARVKGRDARRLSDLRNIQNALELYYDNQNSDHYPIVTTASSVSDGTNGLATKGITTAYMPYIPDDPSGGSHHYYYISNAAGTYYCLGAKMELSSGAATSTCSTATVDPANGTNYKIGP